MVCRLIKIVFSINVGRLSSANGPCAGLNAGSSFSYDCIWLDNVAVKHIQEFKKATPNYHSN